MYKLNLGSDLYIKGRIGWRGLSKDEYLEKSNYKIINATALMDGYVDWDNCGYITQERYEESEEIMLQEEDLLISKDGTLGKIGYVKGLTIPCTVSSGIFVLRNTIPEILNFDYLYHVLKSYIFKDFINRNKSLGSTINHLYQRDLENFQLDLPNLDNQYKIANILNSIENKISINNKINSELELMAKTIYDYWFLQFEFPNEEGKPYKSSRGKMVWNEELGREIPEGWKVGTIGDLFESQTGFAFKSENWKSTGHPVLTIKAIDELGRVDLKSASFIDEDYDKKFLKYSVENGNLIFAMSGNTIGKVGIIAFKENNILINQRVLIIKTKKNTVGYPYFTLRDKKIQNAIEQLGRNSAQPNISEEQLRKIILCLPPNYLLEKYNDFCESFFSQIIKNQIESQQLSSLRDFLLPLLMNGQVGFKENINVKDIEVAKEEVLT